MAFSLSIDCTNTYQGHKSSVYALASDVENNVFYSAGGDGWIVQWSLDVNTPDGLLIADSQSKIFSMVYDTNHKLVIAGDIDGYIYWIDAQQKKILAKSSLHKGSVFDICILNNNTLMTASADGYICVWDINNRRPIVSYRLSVQGLRCICHNSTKNEILVGASDKNIYVLDGQNFEQKKVIKSAHVNSIFCIEKVSDDFYLSGGRDAVLAMWDVSNFEKKDTIAAHMFTINKIKHLPEISAVVTVSRDKTIRIWDDSSFEIIKSIDIHKGGHVHSVNSALWIPSENCLLTAGDDRVIKRWYIQQQHT